MDRHLAEVQQDDNTHLTLDAEITLCGLKVTELPQFAKSYCTACVDGEYAMVTATPLSPIAKAMAYPKGK